MLPVSFNKGERKYSVVWQEQSRAERSCGLENRTNELQDCESCYRVEGNCRVQTPQWNSPHERPCHVARWTCGWGWSNWCDFFFFFLPRDFPLRPVPSAYVKFRGCTLHMNERACAGLWRSEFSFSPHLKKSVPSSKHASQQAHSANIVFTLTVE